jgi:hypothetical protein
LYENPAAGAEEELKVPIRSWKDESAIQKVVVQLLLEYVLYKYTVLVEVSLLIIKILLSVLCTCTLQYLYLYEKMTDNNSRGMGDGVLH